MPRRVQKPTQRPDERARREFVDTATGEPVKPAPARRRQGDGAAPTGRVVADVEGVEVPLGEDEILTQEGSHPRDQRFDYDPTHVRTRARQAAKARPAKRAKLAKPRELRDTFDNPQAAATAFYNANALFFDGVRDPHDGLRDWLADQDTPDRDQDRILALRGAPAIRAALALVFGRARGRRWDAVERRDLESLGEALEPFYEEPEEGGQAGLYDWAALEGLTADAIESLPAAKREQARALEARREIEEALEELRETYARRKPCVPEYAQAVIERRLAEWQRWADDPRQIPTYACEPDPATGYMTCNYPAVHDELRAIRDACEAEGYDPDWSTLLSREGAVGYPDTSSGPDDPRLDPVDRGPPTCMRSQGGRTLGAAPDGIEQARTVGDVLYQREWKRCGNSPKKAARKGSKGCKCYHDFPANAHGPYWSAFFVDPGGRTRSKYIGKQFREITDAERG